MSATNPGAIMLKPVRMLIAACPLLCCAVALAADPFDTVGPFVQYGAPGQPLQTVFGDEWVTAEISNANGSAGIVGRGDIGVAKIGLTSSGVFDSFAWAGWNDGITLMPADPGLVGQAVQVEFNVGLDWSANLSGAATGQAFVDINLVSDSGTGWSYSWLWEDITRSCGSTGSCGDMGSESIDGLAPSFANGVATFYFQLNLSEPYTIVVGMIASAISDGGSISIDATNSATWAGIGNVSLGGEPLSYAVTSTTGFDYAQPSPVPELPASALLLAGLLTLAMRRARQGRELQ